MKVNKEKPGRTALAHRWLTGVHAGFSLLLALLVAVMLNYISMRHYTRRDISRDAYYALSGKTHSILRGVTNRLDVIVFFQPGQDGYPDIKNLLQEYEYACSNLRIQWLDPDRDLPLTGELAARYGVQEPNVVVFDNQGRSMSVSAEAIADYDFTPRMRGLAPVRTAFRGEQAFSSAILAVTSRRKPTAYFLQGHGEGSPADPDPRRGFSRIAREIEQDYIKVKTLTFGRERDIPADCDVLIIAGPQTDFSMTELDLIARYLENSGRLLALLDTRHQTGLDLILEEWGALAGNDTVLDPTRTLTGRGDLFATTYYEHPITEKMDGITTVFYMPRSVRPALHLAEGDSPDKPAVAWLVACSADGWAETNLEDPNARFNVEEDIPGPVPVALAIEKGPVPGIDVHIRPTRLVVFGDSTFVSNKGLVGGNVNLFMSALNWLLEREELIDIAPKPVQEQRLLISRRQQRTVLWIICAGLPGLVAAAGLVVWAGRRR